MQLNPIGLIVETESGQRLGHVVDVYLEPNTQSVLQYAVKQNRLLPDMMSAPLLIHRSQVVEFTEEKMIVDDASSSREAAEPALQPGQVPAAGV